MSNISISNDNNYFGNSRNANGELKKITVGSGGKGGESVQRVDEERESQVKQEIKSSINNQHNLFGNKSAGIQQELKDLNALLDGGGKDNTSELQTLSTQAKAPEVKAKAGSEIKNQQAKIQEDLLKKSQGKISKERKDNANNSPFLDPFRNKPKFHGTGKTTYF